MNNKILIGSIIAVAILVGVSLSSVVGYQSVESNNITSSPLFNLRSGRATEKNSNEVTCNYVGKGEETNLLLPQNNDKIEKINSFVNLIKRLDDKVILRMSQLISSHLQKTKGIQQYSIEEIFDSLKQLKNNPDRILPYIYKIKKPGMLSYTCGQCPTYAYDNCFLHAMILIILIALFLSPFVIAYLILSEIATTGPFYC